MARGRARTGLVDEFESSIAAETKISHRAKAKRAAGGGAGRCDCFGRPDSGQDFQVRHGKLKRDREKNSRPCAEPIAEKRLGRLQGKRVACRSALAGGAPALQLLRLRVRLEASRQIRPRSQRAAIKFGADDPWSFVQSPRPPRDNR